MLGFSADVFLGMFDDVNYVQQLQAEQAIEQAEDREAEIERQKQERLVFIKGTVDAMKGAQSLRELKKIHDAAVRKLGTRNDSAGVQRVAKELADLSPKFTQETAA
ncbi:hypothetical protein D3C81_1371660 [compost metagenome]